MSRSEDEVEYLPQRLAVPLDIPAEMVLAMATGMEEPKEIASRYGFEGPKWEQLSTWKPFLDAVAKQRAEFEASGYTFRTKVRALTEDLYDDVYRIAKSNDSTLMQKLEVLKFGAKLGDMEPKPQVQANVAGQGFSVTINLGTHGDLSKKSQTIDTLAKHVDDVKMIEEVKPKAKKKKVADE